MKTHLKFPVGNTWICVEESVGHVPEHPDYVTLAVREAKPDGEPGVRVTASNAVQRHTVLEIALRTLELADRMTPETTWSNSQVVGDRGTPPRVLHSGEDHKLVARLGGDAPMNFARNAWAKSERLRARMPVLRAAQGLLEHRADETAAALHMLVAVAELHGGLPVEMVLACDETGLAPDSGEATH